MVKSIRPPKVKLPVALVKRPVPPVMVAVSWLSYTSRGCRYRGQVSLESPVDFIPVSCKPVKAASVGNVWRVLAEVWVEFCCSMEGSQFIRVSEIDHVRVDSALVDGFLSL